MIARTASQSTLDILTRALIAAGVVVGCVVALLAIRTAVDVRSSAVLNADSRNLEAQVKAHAQPPAQSSGAVGTHPRGLDALRILQAAVTQGAVRHNCQLSEFKASTQMAPYTPRYKKNLPDQPWTQMDAHFTISGRLRDVVETLRGLNEVPVPVEIDALNIAREKISDDGATSVTAQIDLRALAQGAPS